MNLIFALLLLAAAAAPLAVLGGWLAGRRDPRSGSLIHVGGSEGWWRQAMPWPQGVQEDDDVHWNFGPSEAAREQRIDRAREDVTFDAVPLRPGVRRRLRGR
jgi:hypothetical protein